MIIKNTSQLLKNHTGLQYDCRQFAIEMINTAINAVKPEQLIGNTVSYDNSSDILSVQEHQFVLKSKPVYLIGGGKATGDMAVALVQKMGARIAGGVIIVPSNLIGNYESQLGKIEILPGDHPIPSAKGVQSVKQLFQFIDTLPEESFIICLISGGGSSLLPAPVEDISLGHLQETNRLLLHSGATIHEINTVRKHLSGIKGGRLAARLFPRHWCSLIISDVVGNFLESIASGPTVMDPTTFTDAVGVLQKYQLTNQVPAPVYQHILDGEQGKYPETIKDDHIFEFGCNIILGDINTACNAALDLSEMRGVPAHIIDTALTGEASVKGQELANILETNPNGLDLPYVLIYGGETTVTVRGKGDGGRNQELALSAARFINTSGKCLVSISTDGIDGTQPIAGAIVDETTKKRAIQMNLDIEKYLTNNDSYNCLSQLGEVVITGSTGTNVMDFQLLIALKEKKREK